jgi:hypothetical protein
MCQARLTEQHPKSHAETKTEEDALSPAPLSLTKIGIESFDLKEVARAALLPADCASNESFG